MRLAVKLTTLALCALALACSGGKKRAGKTSRAAKDAPPPTATVALDQTVRFTFGPEKGCVMGDMDTIAKELHRKRGQRLLFTMEPLLATDKRMKPVVHDVNPSEAVASGVTVDFKLPPVTEPVHLGLFVCKDNKREGRCAGKKPYNLAKMTNILFFKGPQRADKVVDVDKPYYFQYVLYDGKELRFMTKAVNSEAKFKQWAQSLEAELGKGGDRKYHREALERAGFLQKMLTSKRIDVQKGKGATELAALLPYLDEKRCATSAAANEKTEPFTPRVSPPDPNYKPKRGKRMIPTAPTNLPGIR